MEAKKEPEPVRYLCKWCGTVLTNIQNINDRNFLGRVNSSMIRCKHHFFYDLRQTCIEQHIDVDENQQERIN